MSTTGKLTNEQKTILNGFTDEYKAASRKERKSVIKEALTALFPAVSDNDKEANQHRKEQIRNIQKVGFSVGNIYQDTDGRKLQAASNYLANYGRRVKKASNPTRTWTVSQVVGKLFKEEVESLCEEESGLPKGSTGFFSVYQKVLSQFVKAMSKEDRDKYRKMAREWSERSPPKEVQQE